MSNDHEGPEVCERCNEQAPFHKFWCSALTDHEERIAALEQRVDTMARYFNTHTHDETTIRKAGGEDGPKCPPSPDKTVEDKIEDILSGVWWDCDNSSNYIPGESRKSIIEKLRPYLRTSPPANRMEESKGLLDAGIEGWVFPETMRDDVITALTVEEKNEP